MWVLIRKEEVEPVGLLIFLRWGPGSPDVVIEEEALLGEKKKGVLFLLQAERSYLVDFDFKEQSFPPPPPHTCPTKKKGETKKRNNKTTMAKSTS